MNDITREWVRKAEEDYSVIEQLFLLGKNPPLGVICFHAQQCIEKYLKALLIEHEIGFPRTHSLVVLIDLILPIKPDWTLHRDALGVLTNYAIVSRYPFEEEIDRKTTQNAVDITLHMRDIIRTELT